MHLGLNKHVIGAAAVTSCIVALLLTGSASAAPASPDRGPDVESAAVLGDAITAIEAGDDDHYDEIVDRVGDGEPWLPNFVIGELLDRDIDALHFWIEILADADIELYSWASVFLDAEREALNVIPVGGVTTPGQAEDIGFADRHGASLLEVLKHRNLPVPPAARRALSSLDATGGTAPDDSVYEQAGRALDDIYFSNDPFSAESARQQEPLPDRTVEPSPQPRPEPPAPADPPPDTAAPPPPIDTSTDLATSTQSSNAADTSNAPGTPVDASSNILVIAALAIAVGSMIVGVSSAFRSRRHDRLADIAYTDSLTGLRNRRRMDADVAARLEASSGPTATLMIDVDHFKAFNDTHGHATGDEVLRLVGATLSQLFRKTDVPYRYGGEEFCVLLPDSTKEDALHAGERIRAAIQSIELPIAERITVSIGVSIGPASEVDKTLERADVALFDAKQSGRNRVAVL